jgi:co-chaperonin GroES (HSP10)
MIQAIGTKIVVEVLIKTKTRGGILIPTNVIAEPQSYGKVLSVGEDVKNVKVDDTIVFHPNAGLAMTFNKIIYKVLENGEVYGILSDESVEELHNLSFAGKTEGEDLIRPVPNIIHPVS